MINLEELNLLYFQNGLSVPYKLKKGDTIYINPVLVKDYSIYEISKHILNISKNEINDINIIQMSYLDFLVVLMVNQKELDIDKKLTHICNLCLGTSNIAIGKDNNKTVLVLYDENENIQNIISAKEFDEISKIILNQNDVNYDDRYLSPDVKEAYEEYCKLKYKDISTPSLEKRKAFVMSKSGYSLQEINEMTYRIFDLVYRSGVDSEIYIGEKIIQGSYKYQVKEDVQHPQFAKDVDPIVSMFADAEAFEQKVQQTNG